MIRNAAAEGAMNSEEALEQYKRDLDKILPNVTSEAVAEVMQGFPLPLAGGWGLARLATVVRRLLARGPRPKSCLTNGHRGSPYFIEKNSIKKMSRKAETTAHTLKNVEMSIRGRIIGLAMILNNGENQKIDYVGAMRRYDDIIKELEWLTNLLGVVASSIKKPAPKWEAATDREWRIDAGWGLAAIYEVAFERRPTAHKSESDDTPFMKFFQRMMALAFGLGGGGPDFKAIAIAACKRHRDSPASCDWLSDL
jgi:hypothetical protein